MRDDIRSAGADDSMVAPLCGVQTPGSDNPRCGTLPPPSGEHETSGTDHLGRKTVPHGLRSNKHIQQTGGYVQTFQKHGCDGGLRTVALAQTQTRRGHMAQQSAHNARSVGHIGHVGGYERSHQFLDLRRMDTGICQRRRQFVHHPAAGLQAADLRTGYPRYGQSVRHPRKQDNTYVLRKQERMDRDDVQLDERRYSVFRFRAHGDAVLSGYIQRTRKQTVNCSGTTDWIKNRLKRILLSRFFSSFCAGAPIFRTPPPPTGYRCGLSKMLSQQYWPRCAFSLTWVQMERQKNIGLTAEKLRHTCYV